MVRLTDTSPPPTITVGEVTNAAEIARARQRREQADRNWNWLRQHLEELAPANRGRYVCVAGEEAFIADDPAEARRLARAAHPDDEGSVLHRFRTPNRPLIYAHTR
jgi:hypothetical protein